jgi:hypothetical protein
MLYWQIPWAIAALVPVVLVESLVVQPVLDRPLRRVAPRVFAANALSTFVGIPLAWIALLAINFATTGGTARGFDTPWAAFQSIVLQAS